MFTPQNKFIIVDDIDDHLNKLSKQFHDSGIGCRALKYDGFYDEPLKGIKVAFFDINLNPSGGSSDKQIFNSLATAIKQYIHFENGPFALIFWTSNTSMIEDFKKFIEERHEVNMPSPFMINCIDKHHFLGNTDNALQDKLNEILNDEILQLLFGFEASLNKASSTTINKIYKIVPKQDKWGYNENLTRNFELIFSKIAISTLGIEHAKLNPDKAVFEALSQILIHQILQQTSSNKWSHFLTSLQSATKMKDIHIPDGFKESELNSIFHIDTANLKKDARGVVLNISKNEARIKKIFNKTYEEWFKSIIPLKKDIGAKELLITTEKIALIIKSSKLIAIEISSACDYSQNKSRLNKYLYGVIINKDTFDHKLLSKPVPDSSLEVGTFFLNNKEFHLWVNFNYTFTSQPSNKQLGNPLFLLKKEMIDMIGNRYANHGSRIGITSF